MKKKLIQINTVCNGSTGNIMRQIQIAAIQEGYEAISFYGRRKGYPDLPCERFGSFFGFWSHVIWTTVTDRQGLGSSPSFLLLYRAESVRDPCCTCRPEWK